MLRQIRGKILEHDTDSVIIDVNGLGIYVYTPNDTVKAGAKEAIIYTHMVIKEGALDLYGFKDEQTLSFFNLLLSVQGVGPKSAIGILNLSSIEKLASAIKAKDHTYLTKVAGIGPKLANKIVFELAEKVEASAEGYSKEEDADVLDMLIALGYKERDARKIMKDIPDNVQGDKARLKYALTAKTK